MSLADASDRRIFIKDKYTEIPLDGLTYRVLLKKQIHKDPDVPRIIIPAYQPNQTAVQILQTCLQSIQICTDPQEFELWVIDNCSPSSNTKWLLEWPDINVALCLSQPLPPEQRGLLSRLLFWKTQKNWGSYANAIGLEIGMRLIDPDCKYLLTMHMDTMACHPDWLKVFQSMLNDRVRAAGVCMEHLRHPDGVLHVLGLLADFQKMKELKVDFFPDLPQVDVGDKVTLIFREAGLEVKECRNTYKMAEVVECLSDDSPFRQFNVMRVLDDKDRVIFMHLGRGIRKSDNTYVGETAAAEEWIHFYRRHIATIREANNVSSL